MLRPFTTYMSDAELAMTSDCCEVSEYQRDTYIYKEGDVAHSVYCIFRGTVKVYMGGEGIQPRIIDVLKVGDFVGYEAYYSGHNYASSCVAMAGSVVCSVPMEMLESLVSHNPELTRYMLKRMADALMLSQQRYVRLTQKHVRGRLADTLLQLIDRFGYEPDGSTIGIALSREELASIANMTAANAIRTLSAFADEGVIALDRRRIRVLNLKALHRISIHD